MKEFGPLIYSFWYLLRGAGMTVLMAILGIVLALLQVFRGRLVQSTILGYLFLIRGAAAIYFAICYTLALYGRYLERRVLFGH
jgi:ABC-type amino acid transport system permease subunit